MSALTADRVVQTKMPFQDAEGIKRNFPVAATTVIYKGGFVGLNATGYLKMLAAQTIGTTVAGGDRFVGIALDHIASQTADGDATCEVLVSGCFEHAVTSLAVADIGKPVYASDDNTLTKVAIGNAYVGTVENWSSSGNGVISLGSLTEYSSHKAFWGITPAISCAAANIVTCIHKSQNHNGLVILRALGLCTTDISTTPVYTVQDTAGTTLGITFSPTSATDAGESMAAAGNILNQALTADTAIVIVPAGLGVDVKVTTVSGTGAGKFFIEVLPCA